MRLDSALVYNAQNFFLFISMCSHACQKILSTHLYHKELANARILTLSSLLIIVHEMSIVICHFKLDLIRTLSRTSDTTETRNPCVIQVILLACFTYIDIF
jgi:hypothetical protein